MTAPVSDYRYPLGLFQRTGVELEYMIVDTDSLDVKPISDELIRTVTGEYTSDAEPDGPDGPISWSNELVLHVIELKTQTPAPSLEPLTAQFQSHVTRINDLLAGMNARLLPGAMHPWMDPHREMRLWPHEYNAVYETFDRIFSCKGHGWANLQSTHINLPFADDDEFGRLHAAIRLVLPIIPALSAASPVRDGAVNGVADNRLDVYRLNARRVPSVAGKVIPEPVFTRREYEEVLLGGIYKDLAPLDPDGVLRHEWVNARGCIARFDRGAIEIRVVDNQECPAADLAIVALIVQTLKWMVAERWISRHAQMGIPTEPIHAMLLDVVRDGEKAIITHEPYLRAFGVKEPRLRAGELWQRMHDELMPANSPFTPALRVILGRGTLSTRLRAALGGVATPAREDLYRVYTEMADCLRDGRLFGAR